MKIKIIIFIILFALLLAGSLIPGIPVPNRYHLDKIMHFGAYFFMTGLFTCFLKSRNKIIICVFLFASLGVVTEILQSFIPQRNATIGDALANIAGVFAGYLLVLYFKKLDRK